MEEEINGEEIKKLIKVFKKYAVPVMVICLFFLFYELGFIWGFNQSFHLQKDYYEEKMLKYCICQEKPHYRIMQPLEIPFNISNNSKKEYKRLEREERRKAAHEERV